MFREIDFIINQSKIFYDYYTLKSFSYFNNVAKNGYLDPIGFFSINFIYNLITFLYFNLCNFFLSKDIFSTFFRENAKI